MSSAPRVRSVLLLIVLGVGACLAAGCSRPAAAAWLPVLDVGVSVRRRAQHDSGAALRGTERWDSVALVALRFRPVNPAAALPERGELLPETWIAPCDADDTICLQEAADAEGEIGAALGELQ
jgi:hypothetical protein